MRSRNEWVGVKLNDLGFVGRGKSRHRPRNDPSLYGGPYPFIQTADIMASDLYITSYSQTYSDLGLQQSKMWNENTLCMTIAGENTGEVAILKFKACFPDSVIAFVADPLKADVRFVKYYFDTMKRRIKNISRGATQDNLSLDKLLSLEVMIPPLPIQKRIGDVLSAYDDRKRQTKPVVHCTAGVAEGLRYYRFYFDYSSSRGLVAGNRTTMHANCSFADENPRSIMLRLG
jgi:type I restriction enzyme, S subunit